MIDELKKLKNQWMQKAEQISERKVKVQSDDKLWISYLNGVEDTLRDEAMELNQVIMLYENK